jgi:hypothetical protein
LCVPCHRTARRTSARPFITANCSLSSTERNRQRRHSTFTILS